jgi:hypothetical protein
MSRAWSCIHLLSTILQPDAACAGWLLPDELSFCSWLQCLEQAQALLILAAFIQTCDAVSLLSRATSWAALFTDAIRRNMVSPTPSAAGNDQAQTVMQISPAAAAALASACAGAAVLFGRLQQQIELPGVRREVTGTVAKLLQQLMNVLQNLQLPCSCHIAALELLAELLRCVPSAARSAAATLDQALQQLVLVTSAGADPARSTKRDEQQLLLTHAAVCIGLLPAVAGDAASWSGMVRKLLSSCHDVLDYLLMGLEGKPLDPAYRSRLVAADQAPSKQAATAAAGAGWLSALPWQQNQLLGSTTTLDKRHAQTAKLLLGVCLAALQQQLHHPFPVPVPVPGYSLALLASRMILLDAGAAVAAGAVPASTTLYQELLVMQPQLQQAGWQLVQLVVDLAGQQLQLQGTLLRLVRQALRTVRWSGVSALQAQPVAVRCCMYKTAGQLLQQAGLAGVRSVAAEAVGCAVLELYGQTAADKLGAAARAGSSKGSGQRPSKRPRSSGSLELDQLDPSADAVALATTSSLPAQAAALQLLQLLLEASGQLLPADVRSHVDAVTFHIAKVSSAAALRLQQQPSLCLACTNNGSGSGSGSGSSRWMSGLAAVQVAALQALLTSVLVPCGGHRPPFLSQALLLFKQGQTSSCPAVAAVCRGAAVSCEALLHPRATPISTVRQYTGMEAVQPLVKPCFWTAAEAAAGTRLDAPFASSAFEPPVPGSAGAAANGGRVEGAGQRHEAAASEAGALADNSNAAVKAVPPFGLAGGGRHDQNVVVGYPVQPQPCGEQEWPLHHWGSAAQAQKGLQGAAETASGASLSQQPQLAASNKGMHSLWQQQEQQLHHHQQQQEQQQQQPVAQLLLAGSQQTVAAAPAPLTACDGVVSGSQHAGAAAAVQGSTRAVGLAGMMEDDGQAELRQHGVQPPTGTTGNVVNTAVGSTAGIASPSKGLGAVFDGPVNKLSALAEESSDSEGPLPDIDSGSDSSDLEEDNGSERQ